MAPRNEARHHRFGLGQQLRAALQRGGGPNADLRMGELNIWRCALTFMKFICMSVCMYLCCMHACTCVRAYVRTYILYIYIYHYTLLYIVLYL